MSEPKLEVPKKPTFRVPCYFEISSVVLLLRKGQPDNIGRKRERERENGGQKAVGAVETEASAAQVAWYGGRWAFWNPGDFQTFWIILDIAPKIELNFPWVIDELPNDFR